MDLAARKEAAARTVSSGGGGVLIRVQVQPRAARPGLAGLLGDSLKLRVSAPPLAGRANEAALRLLAGLLGVAPSRLAVQAGASGRRKLILVTRMDAVEVVDRLAAALGGEC